MPSPRVLTLMGSGETAPTMVSTHRRLAARLEPSPGRVRTNVRAAVGRIEDVDIAKESANLAKYSILTQAAASMLTQANSTNDVALMLLR